MKRLVGLGFLFLVLGVAGVGCGDSEPGNARERAVSKLEDAGMTPEQAKDAVEQVDEEVAKKAQRDDATFQRERREEAQEAATERRESVNQSKEKASESANFVKATCVLKGKRSAVVTLKYTDEGFEFTFIGQPVPASGTALYSVTVFDKSGEYGAQLGVKYLNGKQIAYFVFSEDTYEQTNLDGRATVSGETVSASFPVDDLGKLADAGPASWSAAFNVEGDDVGLCPGGYGLSSFPA